MSNATVFISDKGAIYVNDYRITARRTKWGVHSCVDEFQCARGDVYAESVKRGHTFHARNIDSAGYGAPHIKERP